MVISAASMRRYYTGKEVLPESNLSTVLKYCFRKWGITTSPARARDPRLQCGFAPVTYQRYAGYDL
jgi:hypothetical protein